ncbi:cation-transporting P-type ATPase [Streptomyces sp. NPDC002550]
MPPVTGHGTCTTWSVLSPDDVAAAFDVDPARGPSTARAAELLRTDGPNSLPEENPVPGRQRCPAQCRSHLQTGFDSKQMNGGQR